MLVAASLNIRLSWNDRGVALMHTAPQPNTDAVSSWQKKWENTDAVSSWQKKSGKSPALDIYEISSAPLFSYNRLQFNANTNSAVCCA